MQEEKLQKEIERINQKIKFLKKYIGYLIRIAIGSIIMTIFFIYLMNAVDIDLSSLKISRLSLIILAISPTALPIIISYLFYKQMKELNTILSKLKDKIKKT